MVLGRGGERWVGLTVGGGVDEREKERDPGGVWKEGVGDQGL